MPISTSCSCGRKLNLKDELAGKMVKCPQCGNPLRVPDGKSTATAVATPPPQPSVKKPAPAPPKKEDKKDPKAGPKILMGNFKALDEFDAAGNVKKSKKTFSEEEMKSSEDAGNTGGEMAKLAAEALTSETAKPKLRCPGCGRGVQVGDVICTKCGTNIKSGRRMGEGGIQITRGKVIGAVVLLLVCGTGALLYVKDKRTPKPKPKGEEGLAALTQEIADTQKALDERLKDVDQETDRLRPFLAHLGNDAIPVIVPYVKSGTGIQKRKAVWALEILAWNRYRAPEAVQALAALKREPDPKVKESAVNAIFWSGTDPKGFVGYWKPDEMDPQKKTDVDKLYKLPFNDCRETLMRQGVPMRLNKSGKLDGDQGRTPYTKELVPDVGVILEEFYRNEGDPRIQLSDLIQAVRAGNWALLERLYQYRYPANLPNPKDNNRTYPEEDRERAWRCLKDVTGNLFRLYDAWDQWWLNTGSKMHLKKTK